MDFNWNGFFLYSGVAVWVVIALISVILFFSECVSFNVFGDDGEGNIKWFFNFSIFGFGPVLVQYKNAEALEEFKKDFDRFGSVYTSHRLLLIGLDYPVWLNRVIQRWRFRNENEH